MKTIIPTRFTALRAMRYRTAAGLALALAACGAVLNSAVGIELAEVAGRNDAGEVFAFPGERSILAESDCGIVNGRLAIGIPFKAVARIEGLWAPPYVSSDFQLSLSVAGRKIDAEAYVWRPFQIQRIGTILGNRLTTTTTLVPGKRAGILAVTLENKGATATQVPLEVTVQGTLDRTDAWEFSAPKSSTPTQGTVEGDLLVLQQCDLAIGLQGAGARWRWDPKAKSGRCTVSVPPGGRTTVHLAFSIGPRGAARAECRAVAADPTRALQAADVEYLRQVRELWERVPRLISTNRSLVRFYERSLVHFLTNRWDVPEFVLRPYYGTGSIKGGCVCNYLWNFGETWEILPLYDPQAAREHIGRFLKTDLTAHFAFNPLTGKAFGPWYMVNQEKIIGLVYYYVKNIGDLKFLDSIIEGKTVLEHVIANALYGDDLSKPVRLIDYGPSNSHLELRRGYPYNHVMPDLNGRRYANYLMASRLAELAGRPATYLRQRAESLKVLLKQSLWNPRTRWFDFQDAQGRKQSRWTVQVFKLLESGVLDGEQEAGLLGHLNEREFLSEFGLHSLSKTEIAYDPADIDNGGPGCCTSFPPQIAERLYNSGHPEAAEDILRRILWWGERMPYWGDSLVAERIDYRKDTPLQCTIDGVAAAQCIIFGLFGVDAQFDGSIVVGPHPLRSAPEMELRGLRLRGKSLNIRVQGSRFEVAAEGRMIAARIGQRVAIRDGSLTVLP